MANGEPKRLGAIKARINMIRNCISDIEKFKGIIRQNGRHISVTKDDVIIGSINILKYKTKSNEYTK